METLKTGDICGICMDECSKDFLFKTCCTFIVCRVCFNKMEVESFPKNSTCPGCRKEFSKLSLTTVVIDNVNVPLAPCKEVCGSDPEEHIYNCVKCLKLIVNGNNWFEENIAKKFNGLKRKYESCQDEVYARNQRICDLTFENRNIRIEINLRNQRIRSLQSMLLQKQSSQSTETENLTTVSVSTVIHHLRQQHTADQSSPSQNTNLVASESVDSQNNASESASDFESLFFDSSSESSENEAVLSSSSSSNESPSSSPIRPALPDHSARTAGYLTPPRQSPVLLSPPAPRILRVQRMRRPEPPTQPQQVLRRSTRIQLFESTN
jgi:hypothetical protein